MATFSSPPLSWSTCAHAATEICHELLTVKGQHKPENSRVHAAWDAHVAWGRIFWGAGPSLLVLRRTACTKEPSSMITMHSSRGSRETEATWTAEGKRQQRQHEYVPVALPVPCLGLGSFCGSTTAAICGSTTAATVGTRTGWLFNRYSGVYVHPPELKSLST